MKGASALELWQCRINPDPGKCKTATSRRYAVEQGLGNQISVPLFRAYPEWVRFAAWGFWRPQQTWWPLRLGCRPAGPCGNKRRINADSAAWMHRKRPLTCPRHDSNVRPRDYQSAYLVYAELCLFSFVLQQFWCRCGFAENPLITVESWPFTMNKR